MINCFSLQRKEGGSLFTQVTRTAELTDPSLLQLCYTFFTLQPTEHKLHFLVLMNLCSKLSTAEINGVYQSETPLRLMKAEDLQILGTFINGLLLLRFKS